MFCKNLVQISSRRLGAETPTSSIAAFKRKSLSEELNTGERANYARVKQHCAKFLIRIVASEQVDKILLTKFLIVYWNEDIDISIYLLL